MKRDGGGQLGAALDWNPPVFFGRGGHLGEARSDMDGEF